MSLIVKNEDEYEDFLGLWSDLESGLGLVLSHPGSVQEFRQRIFQYDRWMQDLLTHDADVGLYLLFQLAINSPVGYSASHALVCAVLCHLISANFALPQAERDSLVCAALTMNIAMTTLQDELATQTGRPSAEQQVAIRAHAVKGAMMLSNLGITDDLWLETIQLHHKEDLPGQDLSTLTPPHRLAHILHVVDRYAAMISPRQSREGRSATESAQNILRGDQAESESSVGRALVRIVGLCPPGTYVQLDGAEVAVVTRRSPQPNRPDVAIVIDPKGSLLRPPRLHHTMHGSPGIHSALAAAAVPERINHHIILQLGAQAA
jgi:HD-GYP domain-containing protein (c-di-GMP phosphodiesterase class II)